MTRLDIKQTALQAIRESDLSFRERVAMRFLVRTRRGQQWLLQEAEEEGYIEDAGSPSIEEDFDWDKFYAFIIQLLKILLESGILMSI